MTESSEQTVAVVGLSPAQVVEHFPFHLAVDEQLRITQFGRSLLRLIPALRLGLFVGDVLTLRRPQGGWSAAALAQGTELLHIAEHAATGLLLRGQILRVSGDAPGFVFLASPWLEGPEGLDALRLTLGDFALHDVSLDLVQVVQSMRIANDDLRRLTEVLKIRRAEQQKINIELTKRNVELELITSDLADAQEIARLGSWRYDSGIDRLEATDGFLSLFGLVEPPSQQSLASWIEFVYPADRDRVEQAIRDFWSANLDIDFRIVRADGRRRYVHLRSRNDTGAVKGGIKYGTLQDVTPRKRTERLLRKQRRQIRKLALVASTTDNGVLITDSDGRIEWANVAFRRQSGLNPKQLRGRKPGELLQVPETSQSTIQYMRAKLEAKEPFSVELLNASADGRRYWVALDVQPVRDASGQTTHFISVQRDVTEARKQQADLERLRAERDIILDLSPDGFLAFDEKGAHIYSNPAAAQFLGLTSALLGSMDEEAVDERLSQLTGVPESFVPAKMLADGASDIVHFKPSRMTLRRAVRQVVGSTGESRGRVIYLRDITKERELDRMRSEFLATAAHELRTPMSSIHGFSELLMTRELDPPTRREVVETIHSQSNFVVRMVNDLLDLERLSSGTASGEVRITPVGIEPLIRRVLDGLMVEGDPRRVDFLPNGLKNPLVMADADKLAQALINLLANAFRYSRAKGGPIELVLTRRDHKMHREIGILVRDHGIGMTVDQIQKVFDRFYRADPGSAVSGTGLGMTLVKEIMDRMGGTIEIDSTPGLGTTVSLWLAEVSED